MSERIAHEDDDFREEFPSFGKAVGGLAHQACNKKIFKRRLPITMWLPEYQPRFIFEDLVAGLTVGLTAVPQSIAYAVVADLPPQYGLYSAFMGCFVYIFLGSCTAGTIGPTAILAIMTQPYVSGRNPDYAVLLTFLFGIITFLVGILNMGFLVQFISNSVISGFTTAAALTIASGQVKNLLGLPGSGSDFIPAWINFFKNVQNFRWGDTILGLTSLLILLILDRLGRYRGRFECFTKYLSLARNAMVNIGGGVVAYIFYTSGSTPFILTGDIDASFPKFSLPPFSTVENNVTVSFPEMLKELGSAPISVSLIAILEAVTVATIFCPRNKSVDATQEMIAIGASNILGSFFSSIPTTASFTRSAINNGSGVKSTFGGFFTGSLVLLALGLLIPYFYYLPKATLAAVIIAAMFALMEFRDILETWHTKRIDVIPLLTTLFSCLFFGLETGILIGTAVNIFIVLYVNSRPSIDITTIKSGDSQALIIAPNRDIIFSSVDYFRGRVSKCLLQNPKMEFVIIDGTFIHSFDTSAAKKLSNLIETIKSQDKEVLLWNWKRQTRNILVRYKDTYRELFVYGQTVTDLEHHFKSKQVISIQM